VGFSRIFESLIDIKKLILAPVAIFGVISVNGLVYISLVGPKGFYREVFG